MQFDKDVFAFSTSSSVVFCFLHCSMRRILNKSMPNCTTAAGTRSTVANTVRPVASSFNATMCCSFCRPPFANTSRFLPYKDRTLASSRVSGFSTTWGGTIHGWLTESPSGETAMSQMCVDDTVADQYGGLYPCLLVAWTFWLLVAM